MDPEVNTKVTLKGEFIDHKKVERRAVAPMVVQVEELVRGRIQSPWKRRKAGLNLIYTHLIYTDFSEPSFTFLTFYLQNCSASWQFWLRACSVGFLSVARQPEDGRHFYSLHKLS